LAKIKSWDQEDKYGNNKWNQESQNLSSEKDTKVILFGIKES